MVNDANPDQRRTSGRIVVSGVRTNMGRVIDASAGGLRIRGKTPSGCQPGSHLRVEVSDDDACVAMQCEVRWIQRHPFRGATFGVSFLHPDEDDRRRLFSIIRRAGTEARCRWNAA